MTVALQRFVGFSLVFISINVVNGVLQAVESLCAYAGHVLNTTLECFVGFDLSVHNLATLLTSFRCMRQYAAFGLRAQVENPPRGPR